MMILADCGGLGAKLVTVSTPDGDQGTTVIQDLIDPTYTSYTNSSVAGISTCPPGLVEVDADLFDRTPKKRVVTWKVLVR